MRDADDVQDQPWADQVTIVEGDATSYEDVVRALENTDVAYYLLHSMSRGEDLSPHLHSRIGAAHRASKPLASRGARALPGVGRARYRY